MFQLKNHHQWKLLHIHKCLSPRRVIHVITVNYITATSTTTIATTGCCLLSTTTSISPSQPPSNELINSFSEQDSPPQPEPVLVQASSSSWVVGDITSSGHLGLPNRLRKTRLPCRHVIYFLYRVWDFDQCRRRCRGNRLPLPSPWVQPKNAPIVTAV